MLTVLNQVERLGGGWRCPGELAALAVVRPAVAVKARCVATSVESPAISHVSAGCE